MKTPNELYELYNEDLNENIILSLFNKSRLKHIMKQGYSIEEELEQIAAGMEAFVNNTVDTSVTLPIYIPYELRTLTLNILKKRITHLQLHIKLDTQEVYITTLKTHEHQEQFSALLKRYPGSKQGSDCCNTYSNNKTKLHYHVSDTKFALHETEL